MGFSGIIRASPGLSHMPVIVLSGDSGIQGEVEKAGGMFIGKTDRVKERLKEELAKLKA